MIAHVARGQSWVVGIKDCAFVLIQVNAGHGDVRVGGYL